MADLKLLFREFKAINMNSTFENQVSLDIKEENPLNVKIVLDPIYGLFKGARITFDCVLPDNYPSSAPKITCSTKIYHANIDFNGSICFNMIGGDAFSESYRLEQYINGLLWLLNNPNPASPLNSTAVDRNLDILEKNVKLTIFGQKVKGVSFPCYLSPNANVNEKLEISEVNLIEYLIENSISIPSYLENPDQIPLVPSTSKILNFLKETKEDEVVFQSKHEFTQNIFELAYNFEGKNYLIFLASETNLDFEKILDIFNLKEEDVSKLKVLPPSEPSCALPMISRDLSNIETIYMDSFLSTVESRIFRFNNTISCKVKASLFFDFIKTNSKKDLIFKNMDTKQKTENIKIEDLNLPNDCQNIFASPKFTSELKLKKKNMNKRKKHIQKYGAMYLPNSIL